MIEGRGNVVVLAKEEDVLAEVAVSGIDRSHRLHWDLHAIHDQPLGPTQSDAKRGSSTDLAALSTLGVWVQARGLCFKTAWPIPEQSPKHHQIMFRV